MICAVIIYAQATYGGIRMECLVSVKSTEARRVKTLNSPELNKSPVAFRKQLKTIKVGMNVELFGFRTIFVSIRTCGFVLTIDAGNVGRRRAKLTRIPKYVDLQHRKVSE